MIGKFLKIRKSKFGPRDWQIFENSLNNGKNDDFSGCSADKTCPISSKIDENTLKKLLKVAQWVSTAEKSKIPKLVCREFGSYYEFPKLHGFF